VTRRNALKAKGLKKTTCDRFLPNLAYPRLIAIEVLPTRDLFVPVRQGVSRVELVTCDLFLSHSGTRATQIYRF
jgi:hypothetical protein